MFFRTVAIVGLALAFALGTVGVSAQDKPPNPKAVIETSLGTITVELFKDKAPATVVNFLTYAKDGFYEGTIFHRVIRGFMIQGGGFDEKLELKTQGLRGAILNEATNNERNRRGTVAMARLPDPNSARAQFFINTEDNAALDHKNRTTEGFGYCVFGRVIDGMDVVEKIERVRTTRAGDMDDVPREPVIIKAIRQLS